MKPTPSSDSQHDGRRRWGRAQRQPAIDLYGRPEKLHEPSACPVCGAVYENGRWTWGDRQPDAQDLKCPACCRIEDQCPAGAITLQGRYVARHADEMLSVARNRQEAEMKDHPLNRIMSVLDDGNRITINTTDIHLAQRIGKALVHAFHGQVSTNFNRDNHLVTVDWCRDE